jgi:hypothetical protein
MHALCASLHAADMRLHMQQARNVSLLQTAAAAGRPICTPLQRFIGQHCLTSTHMPPPHAGTSACQRQRRRPCGHRTGPCSSWSRTQQQHPCCLQQQRQQQPQQQAAAPHCLPLTTAACRHTQQLQQQQQAHCTASCWPTLSWLWPLLRRATQQQRQQLLLQGSCKATTQQHLQGVGQGPGMPWEQGPLGLLVWGPAMQRWRPRQQQQQHRAGWVGTMGRWLGWVVETTCRELTCSSTWLQEDSATKSCNR